LKIHKRLIVCADDFGLTKGVNNGIVQCFQKGILTSTSLMANGPNFIHALSLTEQNPGLDVGIHLTLTDLMPIRPFLIKDLIGPDSKFFTNYLSVIKKIISKPNILGQIKDEFRAQIEYILQKGIIPSHINSHKHIHIFPPIWKIVLKLAREYRIPFVRYPAEKFYGLGYIFLNKKHQDRYKILLSYLFFVVFLKLFDNCNKIRANSDIKIPDYFCGLFDPGTLGTERIIAHIKKLSPGTTELMCHPGYLDKALLQLPTRLLISREKELKALCSPEVRQAIKNNKVMLTSFRDNSAFTKY